MTENNWHRGDWMQTYTGKQFYPLSPRPEDIDIIDIAHSLSLQCRYNGHVDRFYSVAEHCILMASKMPTKQLALEALLHDAAETYVGDMVRPLKINMPQYVAAEKVVELAIAHKFGLPINFDGERQTYAMPPVVKEADTRILLTERAALMGDKQPADWVMEGMEPLDVYIYAWSPQEAENQYLSAFEKLVSQ